MLYTTKRTYYAHARKTAECLVILTWFRLLLSDCVCMPAGHTYKPWSGQLEPVRRNVKQRWLAGWTLLCSRWLCGALQLRPLPSCRPAISRRLPRQPTRHRRCYTWHNNTCEVFAAAQGCLQLHRAVCRDGSHSQDAVLPSRLSCIPHGRLVTTPRLNRAWQDALLALHELSRSFCTGQQKHTHTL